VTFRRVLTVLLAAVLGTAAVASAQERMQRRGPESRPRGQEPRPAAQDRKPARSGPGALEYVDGLEALEAGEYRRAVDSFGRAIAADGDNADYHLGRGVANTLAEQFPAAVADLDRAQRLRPESRETSLWLKSAHQMANDETFRNPRTAGSCFVHGFDVPPRYAEVVCNQMAMEYWSSRHRGMTYDREQRRAVQVSAPIKTHFPDAAREFVTRHKGSIEVSGDVLLSRMKAAYERGDYPAAMKDLVALRRASPDDTQLRAYWASCLLATGNALDARTELTRALVRSPFWTSGYVGRAEAAAALGDEARAAADLRSAAALKASSVETVRQKIAAVPKPPDDAVQRFASAVRGDAQWSALVDAAVAVHRWSNARRSRYDEAYQDRIRVLHEAVRDDARSVEPYEMAARFLHHHRDVPKIWNGPRGGGEQIRPQSPADRQWELAHALDLVNDGLKVNGRHANSLATKAVILFAVNRGGEAMSAVEAGLAIDNKNVRLLRMKAESLAAQAGALASQAAGLRAGTSSVRRERRSDGEYEITTRIPPSQADLRQAAGLEAQAAALQAEANRLAREAQRIEAEVIPALVRDGERRLNGSDGAGALRAFQQAAAHDPDTGGLDAHFAEAYKRLGDGRRAQVYALVAEPMKHTTAADLLKTAWQEATRTAWRSAGEALDRGAATDAADARVPAYRSVVAAGLGDAGETQRQRLAALALEEARARLMATTFAGESGGPLDVDDVGLSLVLRLEQGRAFLAAQQGARAAEMLGANVAMENRLGKDHLVDLVPSGMLPDATLAPGRVPEAPSVAALIAWSRLEWARALAAAGRPADARREFLAVRAYQSSWPATVKGAETMNVVDSWARLGLAELAVAARDWDEAFRLLMSGEGFPWGLPPELDARRKALAEQVVAARRQRGAPPTAFPVPRRDAPVR
jgi:tetratricopeptide (TPR) repeat protein